AAIFYRRSWLYMLPLAIGVSVSRIYNGVHYPSDILAGAILGAGFGFGVVYGADRRWKYVGQRWFPLWLRKLPSLVDPNRKLPDDEKESSIASRADLNLHLVRLGYIFILLLFVLRLFYIHSSVIELSEDEAYQWTWSKNLALSYYSKPPL